MRKRIQEQADGENYQGTPDDFQVEIAPATSPLDAPSESQRNRHAYDEKEKREDEISRSPTVPGSMFKGPVDIAPGAWIVYEHHSGNGDSTKHIKGDQPVGCGWCSGVWHLSAPFTGNDFSNQAIKLRMANRAKGKKG